MTAAHLENVLIGAGVSRARAARWSPALYDATQRACINTPLRLGHFLAQVLHESHNLIYEAEVWGPTAAQKRYEGRRDLGNTVKGDGYRFRGRGPIQLTGRANYTRFNAWLRTLGVSGDVVANPDLLLRPAYGALAAAWFWSVGNSTGRSLNAVADRGDDKDEVQAITRVVNGGYNGLSDRVARFVRVMLPIRKIPSYTGDNNPL